MLVVLEPSFGLVLSLMGSEPFFFFLILQLSGEGTIWMLSIFLLLSFSFGEKHDAMPLFVYIHM